MNCNKLRGLIFAAVVATTAPAFGGVAVSITVAPPPLRVYAQPPCPGDDYIWTPGHWAYGPTGYHWVSGAWVLAPHPGYLFTPGYWSSVNGVYVWHDGHWGLHIGYYGGVNYGFGYTGEGFHGGYWRDGHFFYNRAVANVDERRIHHLYREERRDAERRDGERLRHDERRDAERRDADRHDADRRRHDERRDAHAEHAREHKEHAAHEHTEKGASHSKTHSGGGHTASSHSGGGHRRG